MVAAKKTLIKAVFRNTKDMQDAKRALMPLIRSRKQHQLAETIYETMAYILILVKRCKFRALNASANQDDNENDQEGNGVDGVKRNDVTFMNAGEEIVEMWEHDVPYVVRYAIDNGILLSIVT